MVDRGRYGSGGNARVLLFVSEDETRQGLVAVNTDYVPRPPPASTMVVASCKQTLDIYSYIALE